MTNKTVQQRLCTEPNEEPEALRFAVAFEEGVSQHRSLGGGQEVKLEPLCQINESARTPCSRCGIEFTTNHLQKCKAMNEQCRSCGRFDHFARMCKRVRNTNSRGNDNIKGKQQLEHSHQD